MAEEAMTKTSKSMLIIKLDANSLKGVEPFLKNRDWILSSAFNLKEAILLLVKNKPDFVLVPVNHPHPKMRKLPQIIAQAFPCCVMVYADKATTQSFKALNESPVEYKISPPVTGPAVERAVNKFIRDRDQVSKHKTEGRTSDSSGNNNFEFKVEIKSATGPDSGNISVLGGKSEGVEDSMSLTQKLLAQLNLDEADLALESSTKPNNEQQESSGIFSNQKTDSGFQQNDSKANSKAGASAAPNSKPLGEVIHIARPKPGKVMGPQGDLRPKARGKISSDLLHVNPNGYFHKDSVLVKAVSQAVDQTAVKGSGVIESEIDVNSHLACIIVESTRFSGYLVTALGKDKKIDSSFIELVRTRLLKFLVDNGEPIDDEKNLQIKVKQVDFEGWALKYAQFLRKSVHKGDEVAMAFFPFADAKTKVGESAKEQMVSVEIEEIKTNVPLEFNMYIYLAVNRKYVLYTPQGGSFLTEQKERLTRQGVKKMHIEKGDVQNLSKFKAQNHLNTLIDDYKSKPAKKKAS